MDILIYLVTETAINWRRNPTPDKLCRARCSRIFLRKKVLGGLMRTFTGLSLNRASRIYCLKFQTLGTAVARCLARSLIINSVYYVSKFFVGRLTEWK